MYDVRTGKASATLKVPDAAGYSVPSLSFSENGYHLCGPGSPSTLNIWDLRKLSVGTTIDLGDGFKVNNVKYDVGSALLLGVAGNMGVRVHRHKTWDEIVKLSGEKGPDVVDLDWSTDGSELWSVAGREVTTWGVPA
jgi:pre-mRNA-processing factor 19